MEKLNICGVTLEGCAQGGIKTSIAVPELRSIFDIGTIPPGALRYRHLFVTHGHPDHIGALYSLVGRREMNNLSELIVHVPEEISDDLKNIFFLWRKVNKSRLPLDIIGHKPGDRITLRKGVEIIAFPTYHYRVPSIGWVAERTTQKLQDIYSHLTGPEIGGLKKRGVNVTVPHKNYVLAVPGDTTIEFLTKHPEIQVTKVLVHEVTYWDDSSTIEKCRQYGHTHIDDMIKYCEMFRGEALVLCHRSMKFSRKQIEKIARKKFPPNMIDKIYFFDGGDRNYENKEKYYHH